MFRRSGIALSLLMIAFGCSGDDGMDLGLVEQEVLGEAGHCTTVARCPAGEGDCNLDSQCQEGLVCAVNNGAQFGFSPPVDVCVVSHCTNGVQDVDETAIDCGGADCGSMCAGAPVDKCTVVPANGQPLHCTAACPCPTGGGDCNLNSDCQAGLVCSQNNGAQFGFGAPVDVCVVSHCDNGVQDADETAIDCGGADCGSMCAGVPVDKCTVVPANGQPLHCTAACPCPAGGGDCNVDSECQSGLVCAQNVGANYGFGAPVDVCESSCGTGVKDANETGVDCGGSCPACSGQCSGNPCDLNATCTETADSFECDCNAGYTGNGLTCTAQDPCASNPCGAHELCSADGGSFTCSCDLTGTWAVQVTTAVEWDAVFVGPFEVISAGSASLLSWSIRTLDQNGTAVDVQGKSCGGTAPTLCSPFLSEAYSQNIPNSVWDGAGNVFASLPQVTLLDSSAGQPFVSPTESTLSGLSLPDPFDPWPATYQDPAITWLDPDGDNVDGIPSEVIATGTAASCGNLPYTYLPHPDNPNVRIKAASLGARVQANLDGTIVDCSTISGSLPGPAANGWPTAEGHVAACTVEGTPDRACTPSEVASLDQQGQTATQRTTNAAFVMVRVSDGITCSQARAHSYP